MNYKIDCIKKACRLKNITLEELMDELNIPYSQYICGKNSEEIYLKPLEKLAISNELNTIVPYFYGIIDDKELFENNLTLDKYHEYRTSFKIEDYLKNIGMESYIHNIFDPSCENYLSECYLNEEVRDMYKRPSYNLNKLSKKEEYYYHYVKINPMYIKNLPNSCEEISISAVSTCGEMMRYIINQTEEIAYRAVSKLGDALEYVVPDLHTPKIVRTALKQNPLSFKFSHLKTYDICMDAVKSNGNNLEFVPQELRDHEMIMTALNSNGWAIKFLDEQTEEYALAAVLQNTESCLYVDDEIRDNNICIKAIFNEIVKKHSFLTV